MNIFAATFLPQVMQRPDQCALIINGEHYSYITLNNYVNQLREQLASLQTTGTAPHSRLFAIVASKNLTTYAAILACLAEGYAWVPLNTKFPHRRNLSILEQAAPSALVFTPGDRDYVESLLDQYPTLPLLNSLCDDLPNEALDEALNQPIQSIADVNIDDMAYLLFTSGTTGEPKGIPVSAGNLSAYLDGFLALYPLEAGLRHSHMFDLTFDLSIHDLLVCWKTGGTLVVPTAMDVLMPIQYIRKHQINIWFSVPSMANLASNSGLLRPNTLPSLTHSFFCGEALPYSTATAWQVAANHSRLTNLYGPTEATIAITAYDIPNSNTSNQAIVPIGTPYPNQSIRVVSNTGHTVNDGDSGELWLAGTQITQGYLNNPSKTAAAFVEQTFTDTPHRVWYRTGDLVRYNAQHGLEYLGRIDRQTQISGYRVELLTVEHHLRQAAQTDIVAVLPIPHAIESLNTGLVGFMVNPRGDNTEVLSQMADVLPDYMVPNKLLRVDSLPLNVNGKVDYNQLAADYKNQYSEQ